MSQSIISDNWSLQDISEMFTSGLDTDNTHYLDINAKKNKFTYKEISRSAITIESFFDFITDIILRDQIIVEKDYVNSWKIYDSPINMVAYKGIIREYPLCKNSDKFEEVRSELVNRLCITDDLKVAHEENKTCWAKEKHSPHEFLSQTLWGGAGMLARSIVNERAYTPHPIRKKLFIDAGIALPNDNAVNRIINFIENKRTKLASIQYADSSELYSLTVNLPPLPIRVIQESNSKNNLIDVALEMRDEYQGLRDWLNCYQQSLSDGSYKDEVKFNKIIQSVSSYVDSKMGIYDSNLPTFTTGIGVFKIAFKGQPLNIIKNQFGVRTIVNKLIISQSGNAELKKFLGFFGHNNSKVELQVMEHFSNNKHNK